LGPNRSDRSTFSRPIERSRQIEASEGLGRRNAGLALHLVADLHLDRRGLARCAPAVEAGPVEAGHLAERGHVLTFRRGLLDFFKQASAPLTTAGG